MVGYGPYPASGKRSSLLCAGGIWLGMRVGEADGYRRREAAAASTPIPVACGSAGGVPCVPAGGDAGAVSSASLRAAAVDGECGRSIEDPSTGFSRANRRRKADGTILRPSVKRVAGDACWRRRGHDGACWRHRLGFVVVNFRRTAALA